MADKRSVYGFVDDLLKSVEQHHARSGPMEIDPRDLVRLLDLSKLKCGRTQIETLDRLKGLRW